MDIYFFALDIFLLVTYFGISIYLAKIYLKWKETSIGLISMGSFFATVSIFIHTMGDFRYNFNYNAYFKISLVLSFISYSILAIAHQAARRNTKDMLMIIVFSFVNGIMSVLLYTEIDVFDTGGLLLVIRTYDFIPFDVILLIYLSLLYLILVRDSEIIYQASIKNVKRSYYRSTAVTHLISWQFFALSLIFFWFLNIFIPSSNVHQLIFELPLILLLVPILTLGSRPFDWAREGYEPIILLLVDSYGNVAYSWTKDDSYPLLMEGSTFSSIESMLVNIVKQKMISMHIMFDGSALYVKTDNGYLSALITTGFHPSFDILLGKIHKILVTSVISPVEFGKTGFEIPNELLWLLRQLLPADEI